jgi:hypothetical protein
MLPLLFPPWSLVLLLMNPFAFTSSCFFFSFCVSLSQTQHHQHQQHRRHYQPQCHSISLPGISKSFVFFVCFSLCASRCVLLILFCFSSVGFLGSGVSRVSSSTASGICINICICIYIHICIRFAAAASELQHHSFSITASASEIRGSASAIPSTSDSDSAASAQLSVCCSSVFPHVPCVTLFAHVYAICIFLYTHTYTIHAYCLLFHRKTRIWLLCSIYSRTPVECTCFYAFLCVFNSAVCFYVFLMSWH